MEYRYVDEIDILTQHCCTLKVNAVDAMVAF